MLTVVNFFRGYLEVEIVGRYPERFINICSQNNIVFWDLQKVETDKLRARVRVFEIERLRELARNALCEVRVLSKRGAPFFVWRFRKRYLFIAGFILFISVLYFFSLRIWDIEVIGNERVSEEHILKNLRDIGISIGTPSSEIDSEFIENRMLLQIPELRWLAVNVRGSRAEVEVRERTEKVEVVDTRLPCNVVSSRAGIITKIVVLEGAAQVEKGDTVVEGQLLASSVVDTVVGMRLVRYGKVEAEHGITFRPRYLQTSASRSILVRKPTKNQLFWGQRLNLYLDSSIPYEKCDKITERTQLSLPRGYVLPITWVSERYIEYEAMKASWTLRLPRKFSDSVSGGVWRKRYRR